jgi:hypothetical protein
MYFILVGNKCILRKYDENTIKIIFEKSYYVYPLEILKQNKIHYILYFLI